MTKAENIKRSTKTTLNTRVLTQRDRKGLSIFSFFCTMGYQPPKAKKQIPADLTGRSKERIPATAKTKKPTLSPYSVAQTITTSPANIAMDTSKVSMTLPKERITTHSAAIRADRVNILVFFISATGIQIAAATTAKAVGTKKSRTNITNIKITVCTVVSVILLSSLESAEHLGIFRIVRL